MVLGMLAAIGLDKRQFGLHSLRSGGLAANAQLMREMMCKWCGRWWCMGALDERYILCRLNVVN